MSLLPPVNNITKYVSIVLKLLLCPYALPNRICITFLVLSNVDFIVYMYLCSVYIHCTFKSSPMYVNLRLGAMLVVSGKNPLPGTIMQSWKSHSPYK